VGYCLAPLRGYIAEAAVIGASPSVLSHRIQPEEAVAVIHHELAGRGEILFRDLIEPPASTYHQSGFEQSGQMLGGVVVAGAGDFGHLVNGARFATAQFLEHLPPLGMSEGGGQSLQFQHGECYGGFGGFSGCRGGIHGNQPKSFGNRAQDGKRFPATGVGIYLTG